MARLILLLSLLVPLMAHGATATWDASAGATGYRLYYGLERRAYDHMLDTGPATSAVVQGLTPGLTYYFAASAYNAAGESPWSEEVAYTVPLDTPDDTTPPQVAISHPADGSTVPRKGQVTITADASDLESGIARVELYVNGILLCTDVLAVYQCPWQVPAAGGGKRYVLEALAVDRAGHMSDPSPPVVVTAR